ncbi:hypothetical protein TSUD_95450 [Trifolium subterraneum]|uniref:Uncharacterized protein n=1 Tax=Trifolium subterraneum TaxID=3900 RepID=A0A2Z6LTV1_TRISU|nr:hypothetical protein TSUD_95450 [Trifolium subterraneum]
MNYDIFWGQDNGDPEEDGSDAQGEPHAKEDLHDVEEDGSDAQGEEDLVDVEEDGSDAECEEGDVETDGNDNGQDIVNIDTIDDIVSLDLKGVWPIMAKNLEFGSLDIANRFYEVYARANGFSIRKGRILRTKDKNIVQRTFLCHREWYREGRGLTTKNQQRAPKPETRCECPTKFRVHIDIHSNRWRITLFTDYHNHDLLSDVHCGMLPAHRIEKQRHMRKEDARNAINYLRGLDSNDPMMFVRYTADSTDRLQHLFWCDGRSHLDYQVFGDVVAFDATYGKNKYHCPLVVFAGVNNHNSTIIFAGAIVWDEKEETYVWVLEQFLEAMSGTPPPFVITNGDVAMKNAIKRVFPNAE